MSLKRLTKKYNLSSLSILKMRPYILDKFYSGPKGQYVFWKLLLFFYCGSGLKTQPRS